MKNILLITKREYLTQVKKKSFVVLTVMAPIFVLIFGALVTYMFQANKTHYNIAVVDKTEKFQKFDNTSEINFQYVGKETENALKQSLPSTEAIDGVLVIPNLNVENLDETSKNSILYTNKDIGYDTRQKIANNISNEIRKIKIKQLGINEAQIQDLAKNFNLTTRNLKDKTSGDNALIFAVKSALGGILMYVTFMFIMIYGVRVMRSVLEEKNNRVVEIIISSVKPFDLMMGKILGVTLVALTQFAVWITMTVTAALVFNQGFSSTAVMAGNEQLSQLQNIQQSFTTISHSLLSLNYMLVIFVFIFFFLAGYIFYSSMYAAIGSAVDNETETQQFTLFAILPLMIGMYGSFSIMNNPEGPLAFWLSIIPLTSPVAMVARIPFGVPVWQLLLSMALLVGSAFFMIYIAGKVYRVGILAYGNKASLKEIIKWIKN